MGNSRNLSKTRYTAQSSKTENSAPTQVNIDNFIKSQKSLENSYDLEQNNYINIKINEIQTAATNKKSAIAWKTINEVSGRKKSHKVKLKATNYK